MIAFRNLTADEIEVRVAMCRENGCQLLLYKNARVDMQILDTTPAVGPENWSREHYDAGGIMFCRVGIYNPERKQWNYKADAGSESNTEPEKGKASDSFKRACTNWGIGRELYTTPFIWVPNENGNYKAEKGRDGKPTTRERFRVSHIEISEDKKITALEIENSAGRVVYTMKPEKRRKKAAEPPKMPLYSCCVCHRETDPKIAIASIKKYGAVYCSKECFEERKINE